MDNEIIILIYMSLILGSISFVLSIVSFLKLKDLDNRTWMDGIKNESNIKNSQYDIYRKIDREIEAVNKKHTNLDMRLNYAEETLEKLSQQNSCRQQNLTYIFTEDQLDSTCKKIVDYIMEEFDGKENNPRNDKR